ncbi:MAG: N-acetylmuramoyl-L-alanine amidase [Hydrotalea flava]|uniref:N-acetylmuramoyl-L-alanine amidase n=2 Tax=Chitinophagaceae TaxID=563835 RepID=UPI0009434202|nr:MULTISPECIES: N-acetylmuramoyl-L-alanine amidase [Hydrotalea]NIM35339.1 N-acetylmuramoyl-L-alanine amidase [Hydrotalea flava]GHU81434.1 N-acetylmuramoyl-L-alanine amidase [Spirochaetia bacterium]NIM38198.1 N-acetylmuramoyl-L-alanine amidase [Hydrotalea flava]NIN03362.1 N-acetylmuramoyl-L-alanine amidase [Hydrotalea flava]NIN15056.1 N-acetylmuramoyl-L-alanine amidase [Hydrotalea flava]
MKKYLILCTFIVGICACSRNPYQLTNRTYKKEVSRFSRQLKIIPAVPANDTIQQPPYFVGTTNFNLRKPNYVIIHHTAQNSCPATLKTFTKPATQVSAHYVICKDGTVYHMLNDYLRAWQAGVSSWGNDKDINSSSIGIELDNNGFEPFDSAQINSLLSLLSRLKQIYHIPTPNFIGHGDIAPTRKNDPNYRFPWQLLAQHGFGNWYDAIITDTIPDAFNTLTALRVIGYNVKDTAAAIIAFKRHFLQDTTPGMTAPARLVLYNLQKKYM